MASYSKDNRRKAKFDKQKKFHEKKGTHDKKKSNFDKEQQALIAIYQDTQRYCEAMYPIDAIPDSTCHDITELNEITIVLEEPTDTIVIVENQDTLNMALNFCNEGLNPLVLNMASKFKPGGGVETGKTAQEEVIFRRTNAFMTHPVEWYPLGVREVIYSPQVHIVKDSDYNFLDESEMKTVSMLAVHAIKNPKLQDGSFSEKDRELTEQKIESIFQAAHFHGHDSLVLGALGCGAYKNPVREILQIFQQMVKKYKGFFKKIGFAVLVIGETGQTNFDLFKAGF